MKTKELIEQVRDSGDSRRGGGAGGALTFNGSNAARTMGGVNLSDLEVKEIMA